MGMLIESGADLNNVPLHLLEPRELEVSFAAEDDNLVGNDYLSPRTVEWAKNMDFSGDNLTRQQMAILSLIPPNHRILGTYRMQPSTNIVDLEHIKKQIQKETIASNKKVWERYAQSLVEGSLAQRLLEVQGPIDFGFDMTAVRDPLKESEGIATKRSVSNAQQKSSLANTIRGNELRSKKSMDSVVMTETMQYSHVVQEVAKRVMQLHRDTGMPKKMCLARLTRVPRDVAVNVIKYLGIEKEPNL